MVELYSEVTIGYNPSRALHAPDRRVRGKVEGPLAAAALHAQPGAAPSFYTVAARWLSLTAIP